MYFIWRDRTTSRFCRAFCLHLLSKTIYWTLTYQFLFFVQLLSEFNFLATSLIFLLMCDFFLVVFSKLKNYLSDVRVQLELIAELLIYVELSLYILFRNLSS